MWLGGRPWAGPWPAAREKTAFLGVVGVETWGTRSYSGEAQPWLCPVWGGVATMGQEPAPTAGSTSPHLTPRALPSGPGQQGLGLLICNMGAMRLPPPGC